MAAPSTDTDGNGNLSTDSTDLPSDVAPPAENTNLDAAAAASSKKWPGWPGHNVFRMVVPVAKVGSIIGKKGELIKKLCEETRAKVRILDGPSGTPDRIVVISGKEEPEAEISPAMDAVIRVFKRINGISGIGDDGTTQGPSSVRLLMQSSQAINLIGKQGSSIKSIQESTGAQIRVLTGDELPYYANATEERVVDIQGESSKVFKALKAVVGHLRKFLVDHSVLPLFDKNLNTPSPAQAPEHATEPWNDKAQALIQTAQQSTLSTEYTPLTRDIDSLFLERESLFDSQIQRPGLSSLYRQETPPSGLHSTGGRESLFDSQIQRPGLSSLYRQETPPSGLHSTGGLGRSTGALVTQVTQTMQIPLSYAEDIIGTRGVNIAFIRRTSGAVLTIQESGASRGGITVEIKGTSTQVKIAEELIQDFIAGPKEPTASSYGGYDTGLRSSYPHLEGPPYAFSSLTSLSYSGYGSYRLYK